MEKITKMIEGNEVTIITKDNEPRFKLSDVCRILGIGNPTDVKNRLNYGVVSIEGIQDRLGRTQQATFVNEDGLYDVILDSRKPEAKKFRKWITSDVLPSIRKHGAYMTPETIEQALLNPDTIIQLATNLKSEQEKRKQLEEQKRRDEPYTTFGKVVATSDASINIGSFAKLLYDKHGIKMGRNKLFAWLRDNGYLMRSGREKNQPKQQYIQQGLFETTVTMISRTHGDVQSVTTFVTGKGQVEIAKKIISDFNVSEVI